GFNRFNDAVRGPRADAEGRAHFADGLMVRTVDENFTGAIYFFHARARLQKDGMAVRAAARGVEMRQGTRQGGGEVEITGGPAGPGGVPAGPDRRRGPPPAAPQRGGPGHGLFPPGARPSAAPRSATAGHAAWGPCPDRR